MSNFDMILADGTKSRFAEYIERMKADRLPDEAYVKVGTDGEGHDITVIASVFKFAEPKGKKTEIQVNNPEIAASLYKMQAATGAKAEIDKFIARELYKLSLHDDEIKRMNFDGAIDLYSTVFGVSKDMASKRLRIGRFFIDDNMQVNPIIPVSWSLSHMQELLQYLPDDDTQVIPTVVKWFADGTITDGMSTKDVRKAMKAMSTAQLTEGKSTDEGKTADDGKGKTADDGKASPASDIDVTVIDRLNDMPTDAKVGHVMNGVTVIESIINTLDLTEEEKELSAEAIAVVRSIMDHIMSNK